MQFIHASFDGPYCETRHDVDGDSWESTARTLLADFGRDSGVDGEYLILHDDCANARMIGPWRVNTAQIAGTDGAIVMEFITEDESGAPESHRAFRLLRRHEDPPLVDAGHLEDEEDGELHPLSAALCLFRCFVERRDLTHLYRLDLAWPASEAVD